MCLFQCKVVIRSERIFVTQLVLLIALVWRL